ncbi:MAG: hypothetical protein IPG91_12485 [Ideonella sp.]|nr:hypothetical protein [Ideonella sp.]
MAAGLQDVGDLAHGDGLLAHVAQALVDGQLLLVADAQRLVELAAGLQDVGDLALRDGFAPCIAQAPIQGQLDLAPVLQRLVVVAQLVEQAAEFVERRHQQFVRRGGLARQPASDLGDAAAALGHRAGVGAGRPRRERHRGAARDDGCAGEVFHRRRCGQKGIDAASPGPQVGRSARGQRNRVGVEPEHQPRARLRSQAFAARVEGVPARCIEPARPADNVHHAGRAGVLDEPGFEHGHVGDLLAQRQAVGAQARSAQHLVERHHHLPAQVLVGRIDEQPLKRRAVQQRARQAQEVVVAGRGQTACRGQAQLFDIERGAGQGAGGLWRQAGGAAGAEAASAVGSTASW